MLNLHDQSTATCFAALGDKTRLHLVQTLSRAPSMTITELSTGARISRQAITKHLKVLESAKLVSSQKVGREMRFSFEAENIEDVQSYLSELIVSWDSLLMRFKDYVEQE